MSRVAPSFGKSWVCVSDNCFWAVESDLGCRRDGAGGHPDRVDASVGVLVDSDVGSLPLGLDVPRRVKQVQHLLVVQLEGTFNKSPKKTGGERE